RRRRPCLALGMAASTGTIATTSVDFPRWGRTLAYSPPHLPYRPMLAILSDIHANQEALQAVLQDISLQSATGIYCLGDTVGYGPDPCACLDLVAARCKVTLLGNHDYAALYSPVGFRDYAQRAVLWTTKKLLAGDAEAVVRRLGFLQRCPHQHLEGSAL